MVRVGYRRGCSQNVDGSVARASSRAGRSNDPTPVSVYGRVLGPITAEFDIAVATGDPMGRCRKEVRQARLQGIEAALLL